MSQQELLIKAVRSLDALSIDYMITGSLVSSLQGEPRSTHDIDIVVSVNREDVINLADAFPPPRYHVDVESIKKAISQNGMFNMLDLESGDRIDFWLLTENDFDRSRFERKIRETIFGVGIDISTPEDTILMKLRWGMLAGGSEKQFTDALRVYELQYATLDFNYMKTWAQKLGITALMNRLIKEAEPV
ncbi:MAG: hypothetical protein HY751_06520 [Nitrospinae bacterium]|nr:hypothetical protein [Nitrospinota bacterium]